MTWYEQIIQMQAHELAESKQREAGLQARSTIWAAKATEETECNKPLRARVKTLEDALKAMRGFYENQQMSTDMVCTEMFRVALEALAAKEPR